MTLLHRLFLPVALVVALLSAALLAPGLGGGFLFDDKPNIVHNTALHITTLDAHSLAQAAYSFQPGGGSRALAELTFAIDHWRGGLDPATFKSTNLLIHALTAFALAFFFRSLLLAAGWRSDRAGLAALFMATAWAVHPLQVSSVLYVVQRMQTLCTLFVVLALWSYLTARLAQRAGDRSRLYWVLAGFSSVLAFASKEDAVLLPLYALALELTVLRFAAATPSAATNLRRLYAALAVVGAGAFFLLVLPRYWHWDAYPGRDFSSGERLLTQARILLLHLGQIVWPLPDRLPFYYDGLTPSRGFLQPVTTLFSLLTVAALLASAVRARNARPLFSLGVLLFFAGHALTSNVIPLELAFEHRNHFPLVGAVLALTDLGLLILQRLRAGPTAVAVFAAAVLVFWSAATWVRSYQWGDPMRLAQHSVTIAPDSARAWLDLCGLNYERSESGTRKDYLDRAIDACTRGGHVGSSAAALANVVIFKTMRGDVAPSDWKAYLDRLRTVPLNAENKHTVWVVMKRAADKVPLDGNGILAMIEIVSYRAGFTDLEYARIAYLLLDHTTQREEAYPYFELAIRASPRRSPLIGEILSDLAARRPAWHTRLLQAARESDKL